MKTWIILMTVIVICYGNSLKGIVDSHSESLRTINKFITGTKLVWQWFYNNSKYLEESLDKEHELSQKVEELKKNITKTSSLQSSLARILEDKLKDSVERFNTNAKNTNSSSTVQRNIQLNLHIFNGSLELDNLRNNITELEKKVYDMINALGNADERINFLENKLKQKIETVHSGTEKTNKKLSKDIAEEKKKEINDILSQNTNSKKHPNPGISVPYPDHLRPSIG